MKGRTVRLGAYVMIINEPDGRKTVWVKSQGLSAATNLSERTFQHVGPAYEHAAESLYGLADDVATAATKGAKQR